MSQLRHTTARALVYVWLIKVRRLIWVHCLINHNCLLQSCQFLSFPLPSLTSPFICTPLIPQNTSIPPIPISLPLVQTLRCLLSLAPRVRLWQEDSPHSYAMNLLTWPASRALIHEPSPHLPETCCTVLPRDKLLLLIIIKQKCEKLALLSCQELPCLEPWALPSWTAHNIPYK